MGRMSKTRIVIDPGKKRAEQERLVRLFVQVCEGCQDYDRTQQAAKITIEGMRQSIAALMQAALALEALASDEDPVPLVKTVRARHDDDPSLAQFHAYRTDLELVAAQCRKFATDLEESAINVARSLEQPSGNQSTLPLRMMAFAAATAYFRLTGQEPSLSRSDYRPFGRFVRETIELIPQPRRPLPPSPTAIADVVKVWRRSDAVRNWKATLKRQAEA